MKFRVAFEPNDFRVGLAWDRLRRTFTVALPFLCFCFELGGGVVTRALPAPEPADAAGMQPDDVALLAAIKRDPHLHWQELRKRVELSATRAVLARERLLTSGKITKARNDAGQHVLHAVEEP